MTMDYEAGLELRSSAGHRYTIRVYGATENDLVKNIRRACKTGRWVMREGPDKRPRKKEKPCFGGEHSWGSNPDGGRWCLDCGIKEAA